MSIEFAIVDSSSVAYHDPRADGDATAAVGVGNDISIADRKEGDGNHPHGIQEILMSWIVIATQNTQISIAVDQSINQSI